MADQTITAKIFRYDPSVDDAPYYSTYEVPWYEYITGLEVLHYINENFEQITFDYCCRSNLCGRCTIMVDGVPGLACWRCIEPGEHTFDPLTGFPVIRDLVVDRSHVMKKMLDSHLAVQSVDPITTLCDMDREFYWNTMERLNMCRECMACYSVCTALQENNKWETYVGPAAMAQIGMRYLDPEEKGDRVAQAVFSGVWDCQLCGKCSGVCPSGIDHVALFKQLRDAAEARGLKPSSAA